MPKININDLELEEGELKPSKKEKTPPKKMKQNVKEVNVKSDKKNK